MALLCIDHCNIQGVANKEDELSIFFERSTGLKVIYITEHWLSEDNQQYLDRIHGFSLQSGFFRKKTKRGGSCILVHNSWENDVLERTDLVSLSVENILEVSAIEVLTKQMLCVCIYRTPYTVNLDIFFQKIYTLLENIFKTRRAYKLKVLVAGVFNVNLFETNSVTSPFINLFPSFGLKPKVNSPTRVTHSTSTCIDYIFTNFEVAESFTSDVALSDHNCQFVNFKSNTL